MDGKIYYVGNVKYGNVISATVANISTDTKFSLKSRHNSVKKRLLTFFGILWTKMEKSTTLEGNPPGHGVRLGELKNFPAF